VDRPNQCVIPQCPVCDTTLHVAHDQPEMIICVCRGCGTSLSIPKDAWVWAKKLKDAKL
jgi:hypothetical protein